MVDAQGNITLSNEQLIGWTGQLRLQYLQQLFPDPHELIQLNRALSNTRYKRGSLRLNLGATHGGSMPVDVRIQAFVHQDVPYHVLLISDLRKDLQWESTLSSAQHQHVSLLNAVSTAVAIVRVDTGEVLQKNESFGQWYGAPGQGLVSDPIDSFFVESQTWPKICSRLQRQPASTEMTAGVYNPDRTPGWARISAQPLHFDGFPCVLLSFEDVTEFEQTRKALKVANKLLNAVVTTQAQYVSDIDSDSLFQHVLQHVFELTFCRFGFIATINPRNATQIYVHAFDNKDWNVDTTLDYVKHRMEQDFNTWYSEQNPFFDSLYHGTFRTFRESRGVLPFPWLKNFASVALFSGGTKVGMLGIGNYPQVKKSMDAQVFTRINPLLVTLGNTIKAWNSDQALKQAQQERIKKQREAENLYTDLQDLIDHAAAPIFCVNTQFMINHWNHSAKRLSGISHEGVQEKPLIYQWVDKNDHHILDYALQRVFQNETVSDLKLLFRTPEGSEQILCSFTPRHDEHGKIVGAWGITQNIMALADYQKRLEAEVKSKTAELRQLVYTHEQTLREHKQSREQQAEHHQLQDRFSALASHEFRGPLSAILMTVENLENHFADFDREGILHKIQRIRERSEQLHDQAHDILLLTQLDSDTVRFHPVRTDVEAFCLELAEEVMLHTRHTHAIEVHLSECEALIDTQLMTLTLSNLLENAVKYSPDARQVHLHMSCDDSTLTFRVCDTGVGILPEEREEIFKPFYRSKRVSQKTRGSGLGLEIVRRSLELHGGSITLLSEPAADYTTCFVVEIPYRSP